MDNTEQTFDQTAHFQVLWSYDVGKSGRVLKSTRVKVRLLEIKNGKEVVAYRHLPGDDFLKALDKAMILARKLEKLWPCHPLAKEYPDG
jgi:hypothetical protein